VIKIIYAENTLKSMGINRTENADIPNNLIQKCNIIISKGGLLPFFNVSIIIDTSNCAWNIVNGSSIATSRLSRNQTFKTRFSKTNATGKK
jgi:hypothetical protein